MQHINNFINRFQPENSQIEKFGSIKSLTPTTYDGATSDVTHSKIKGKEVVRAIAACLSLGISEIGVNSVKFAIGSFLTRGGSLDKKTRANNIADFEKNMERNDPNKFLNELVEKINIRTIDGETLDGVILKSQNLNPSLKTEIWVNGFGQSYESRLNEAMEYANKTGRDVLVFNYRGCGDSTGTPTSANDFVRDTLAMVDFLTSRIDKPVMPENLIIHGFSMGGAIGAKATDSLKNRKIEHQNDRSLAVFSRAVEDGAKAKFGCEALGKIAGGIIKHSGFEINAKKLYVNKDGSLTDLVNQTELRYLPKGTDNVINDENSLHHHIRKAAPHRKINARELLFIDTKENQKEVAHKCSVLSVKYTKKYEDEKGTPIEIANFKQFYDQSIKNSKCAVKGESSSFEADDIAELNPKLVHDFREYVLYQLDKIDKTALDPLKLSTLQDEIQQLNQKKIVDQNKENIHASSVNDFVLTAQKASNYTTQNKIVLKTTPPESFEDFFGFNS
jgi:hypothetical protein